MCVCVCVCVCVCACVRVCACVLACTVISLLKLCDLLYDSALSRLFLFVTLLLFGGFVAPC